METLRTDFIANVSHELKTPLTVLQNYGTLLQQPGLDEPTRQEYARAVTDTARRLASLVTNILRLNKLENQQIYPNAATYDLGEQLRECLLGFEDAWEQKGLCIETDVEDGVLVHTDAELLSLVWNNLFSNAIKFTDAGGTVGLALHARGPDAVVEVRTPAAAFRRRWGGISLKSSTRATLPTPPGATGWGWRWCAGWWTLWAAASRSAARWAGAAGSPWYCGGAPMRRPADWRRLGRRLLYPHPAVVALCVPAGAAGLAYVFLIAGSDSPPPTRSICFRPTP